jgi:hypothetical protein
MNLSRNSRSSFRAFTWHLPLAVKHPPPLLLRRAIITGSSFSMLSASTARISGSFSGRRLSDHFR